MGGTFRFGLIALFAAMTAGSGWALAATQPVVLVEVPGAAPELREKMRTAAEDELNALGVTVPRQLHDSEKAECTTSACIAERSKRFGATHVLEIQGTYQNESYKLRLDVRATNTGRILGSESKECEICSVRDFVRAIKERTGVLWPRVAREQASVVEPSVQASEPTPKPIPLTDLSKAEPRQPRSLWLQPLPLVGLGLMLGGAVAMAFGGYYLAVDGESAPSDPDVRQRATKRVGWGLLAGGGGALLAGTVIVIFGRDSDTSPKVALGPGHLLVSGRF